MMKLGFWFVSVWVLWYLQIILHTFGWLGRWLINLDVYSYLDRENS